MIIYKHSYKNGEIITISCEAEEKPKTYQINDWNFATTTRLNKGELNILKRWIFEEYIISKENDPEIFRKLLLKNRKKIMNNLKNK